MGEADTEIYVLHTLSRLVENVWSVVSAYMPHSEVQSHLQGASFTPPWEFILANILEDIVSSALEWLYLSFELASECLHAKFYFLS